MVWSIAEDTGGRFAPASFSRLKNAFVRRIFGIVKRSNECPSRYFAQSIMSRTLHIASILSIGFVLMPILKE